MNFIAMDFETATHEPHSACSLALVMVNDSKIIGSYYTLIQPETKFFWRNVQIHGIRSEMVQDAPKFPEVWQLIGKYFQPQHLFAAHNASFDCKILSGCLEYYGIHTPHYQSICTVSTSRKLYPQMENHKLNTVSKNLGISLDQHHHALDDSLACANILLAQEQQFGTKAMKSLVKKR